jgi:hypothetical protein
MFLPLSVMIQNVLQPMPPKRHQKGLETAQGSSVGFSRRQKGKLIRAEDSETKRLVFAYHDHGGGVSLEYSDPRRIRNPA